MQPQVKGFTGPAGELAGPGGVVYDTGDCHPTAPSSSGLGHGPFKAATRVRIPSGSSFCPFRTGGKSRRKGTHRFGSRLAAPTRAFAIPVPVTLLPGERLRLRG